MGNVSKEMVDAVRLARLQEWERMATGMPRGQHILSVEMLRAGPNQTAIVLTIARDGKVHQFELVADAKGQHPRPVITRRGRVDCDDPPKFDPAPRVEAFAVTEGPAPLAGGGEDDNVATDVPLNYPPDKEPPDPGVISLGSSLLETTFDLGEQVAGGGTT
jgi:hypothetical protein